MSIYFQCNGGLESNVPDLELERGKLLNNTNKTPIVMSNPCSLFPKCQKTS